MKLLKISLISLMLLAMLLLTFAPVQAGVTRVEFYGMNDSDVVGIPTKFIEAGPNLHIEGDVFVHVAAFYMNGEPFPYDTGWAYGSDVRLHFVDGHAIETMKVTVIPDDYEGGYWEGTYTTIPNSGGMTKVISHGMGTYRGMHMEVTNFGDGTFVGVVTFKN